LTPGDDPPIRAGIWLSTADSLTQLVDIGSHKMLPGARVSQWFTAYPVQEPDGESASATAKKWIMQMCDHGLSLDSYEQEIRREVYVMSRSTSKRWADVPSVAWSPCCTPVNGTRNRDATASRQARLPCGDGGEEAADAGARPQTTKRADPRLVNALVRSVQRSAPSGTRTPAMAITRT
jgi:hypothetical protein